MDILQDILGYLSNSCLLIQMNIRKMGNQSQKIVSECQLSITKAFERGLYEIQPINKTLNKNILSMAYTPGVGKVCTQIQKHPELVNQLTLRGRSVAIVTQGNCFKDYKFQAGKMAPVVDWCIAQIKFYSDIDSFPFLIRNEANITNVLKDLSNVYTAILILDLGLAFDEKQMPNDVAIVRQEDICKITNKEITDCEETSKVLSYIIHNKKMGIANQEIIKEGLSFIPATFKKESTHFILYRDGRNIGDKSFDFHKKFEGKIHIQLSFSNIQAFKKCFNSEYLIEFVKKNPRRGYRNISCIVTDGTRILGLGNIGPKAGLPVMEGKSLLFKVLGGVNIVPICINERKTYQDTVEAILDIASGFKAINLQDLKAPDCFFIERALKERKLLPVFHDDQHGTAIAILAGLINALKLAGKKIEDVKIVISGVGAAGIAGCKLLLKHGAKNIIMADTKGAIYEGRPEHMTSEKQQLAKLTNKDKIKGSLGEIIKGADIFIGVSGPNVVNKQMVKSMKEKPIIFALANPDPEISLEDSLEAGAFIYASGRSDLKNQINNSIVFPGIFRGIHQHDLLEITDDMKEFVAILIAENIDREATQRHIIVDSLDLDIPVLIAKGLEKFKSHENKDHRDQAKL